MSDVHTFTPLQGNIVVGTLSLGLKAAGTAIAILVATALVRRYGPALKDELRRTKVARNVLKKVKKSSF